MTKSNAPFTELEGFDVNDGLARLAGDWEMFAEMAVEYAKEYQNFPAHFRKIVAEGDMAVARREAHSLKGASGNISAMELYKTAKKLEDACAQENRELATTCLSDVEAALAVIGKSAKKIEAAMDGGNDPASASQPASGNFSKKIDPVHCLDLAKVLDDRLASLDPVTSGEKLGELNACLGGNASTTDVLAAIEKQIADYSFKEAAESLQQLCRILEGMK